MRFLFKASVIYSLVLISSFEVLLNRNDKAILAQAHQQESQHSEQQHRQLYVRRRFFGPKCNTDHHVPYFLECPTNGRPPIAGCYCGPKEDGGEFCPEGSYCWEDIAERFAVCCRDRDEKGSS